MAPIRLALVGFGRIARQQHVPALSRSDRFDLVAIVDPHARDATRPTFASIDDLVAAMPEVEALSVCTPPQSHFDIAARAMGHGLHVMLEKPPCASVAAVDTLAGLARSRRVALFAAWHARAAAAVDTAGRRLRDTTVRSVQVTWHEDVRDWHPGQAWIWQAGGFGALDPGINALSLLTLLLPSRLVLDEARLAVPANCAMPAAVRLRLSSGDGIPVDVDIDMLRPGAAAWDITFETDAGPILLAAGGATLRVGQDVIDVGESDEYAGLYARFATLLRERGIDADTEPLRIAEEALATGVRESIAPFFD